MQLKSVLSPDIDPEYMARLQSIPYEQTFHAISSSSHLKKVLLPRGYLIIDSLGVPFVASNFQPALNPMRTQVLLGKSSSSTQPYRGSEKGSADGEVDSVSFTTINWVPAGVFMKFYYYGDSAQQLLSHLLHSMRANRAAIQRARKELPSEYIERITATQGSQLNDPVYAWMRAGLLDTLNISVAFPLRISRTHMLARLFGIGFLEAHTPALREEHREYLVHDKFTSLFLY